MEKNPSRTSSKLHILSHTKQDQNPKLLQPCIVGYMSVDASRNYWSDLSQLKFVTRIPKGTLTWDLNHNIDQAVKRTTDDNDEKIDLLLKFLLDQRGRFSLPSNTFITHRHTLINIMYTAFNINETVYIRACLYKNHIYLNEIKSELEIQRRQSFSDQDKTFCAWGYKFEQYMSSDHPALAPNIDKPVVENEEFSLLFCSEIGDHKLLYGAQVDGLLATGSISPPPDTTDMQETVDYLRQHHFVELKTNKEILTPRQEKNLKYTLWNAHYTGPYYEHCFKLSRRYKLLKCWGQCYLANYKGLVVGFRNDHGIVQRLQWFDTAEIPHYCRREWNPQTALNFLNYFLTFVKNSFHSYNYGNIDSPITLDFHIDINRTIKVLEYNHENHDMLLPDWYIEATK